MNLGKAISMSTLLNMGGYRMFQKIYFLALMFSLFSNSKVYSQNPSPVLSEEDLTIKKVSLRGDGCKEYETATSLSPGKTKLSVIFDNFILNLPHAKRSPLGPKAFRSCTISLYLSVKKGIKITNLDINYDLRGFIYLEQGLSTNISAKALSIYRPVQVGNRKIYRTAFSKRGFLFRKHWANTKAGSDELVEDFALNHTTSIADPFSCTTSEEDTWKIVIKNNAMMIANGTGIRNKSIGELVVDTADFKSGIQFKISHQPCQL
jgi:hypothetical protein